MLRKIVQSTLRSLDELEVYCKEKERKCSPKFAVGGKKSMYELRRSTAVEWIEIIVVWTNFNSPGCRLVQQNKMV